MEIDQAGDTTCDNRKGSCGDSMKGKTTYIFIDQMNRKGFQLKFASFIGKRA